MTKKLEKAFAKFEKAREEYEAATRTELPGGSCVSWMHGRYRQHGIVIDHGYRGRVLVENERTGGRKWFNSQAFINTAR